MVITALQAICVFIEHLILILWSLFMTSCRHEIRRERDRWGDLGVDGWMILGWISRSWDVGIWTGLGWPRIETGGRRL